MLIAHLTWTGFTAVTVFPSSKTGLSIEYEAGGGDFDFFMLVKRRMSDTPFSFFSFCQTKRVKKIFYSKKRFDRYGQVTTYSIINYQNNTFSVLFVVPAATEVFGGGLTVLARRNVLLGLLFKSVNVGGNIVCLPGDAVNL